MPPRAPLGDRATPDARPTTSRGKVLDSRYLIGSRVARGGMATVYEAIDLRLDRTVAVKVMHPGLGDDDEFAARFVAEARAAAKLSHPNVVAVFDQGNDDGTVFLAMELIPGHTLRDTIGKEAPLSPARALALLEPVVSALAAAHRAGLIHRDVKPENVLIADDGRIKVADFGLAKAVSATTQHTATGVLIGTVSYVAPELVVEGRSDARADVYAVGVILYELLTGKKPHEGETPIQVAYKHVHEDVPPPSRLAPGVPDYVDALVARATARDREQRPADAGVLLHHLRRVNQAVTSGVRSDRDLVEDLRAAQDRRHRRGAPPPGARAAATPTRSRGTTPRWPRCSRRRRRARPPRPWSGRAPKRQHHRCARGRRRPPPAGAARRSGRAGAAAARSCWSSRCWSRPRSAPAPGTSAGSATPPPPPCSGSRQSRRDRSGWRPPGSTSRSASRRTPTRRRRAWCSAPTRAAGERVLDGTDVTISLSLGRAVAAVPPLTGITEDEAQDRIQAANMAFGKSTKKFSETVPEGIVIASDPKGGDDAALRHRSSTSSSPRAASRSRSATGSASPPTTPARRSSKRGLEGRRVRQQYSDDVAEGVVISQDPRSGTLFSGDTVELSVSLGPELVEVPERGRRRRRRRHRHPRGRRLRRRRRELRRLHRPRLRLLDGPRAARAPRARCHTGSDRHRSTVV